MGARTARRLTASRAALIGALVVVVAFGPATLVQLQLRWKAYVLARHLRALETERQTLAEEQEHLTSDAVYREGKARSTFKVAKPGELVVPIESDEPRRRAP